jgi:hypothetical protein
MAIVDLHVHPNVYGLPRWGKAARARNHIRCFAKAGVDVVAATEHSYKKPLEAYLRLAEAADAAQGVRIQPGVESVSSESIEVIFLFRDEAHMRAELGAFDSFAWCVEDVARIADATGTLTIVPHPFHICRSAACNVLSRHAYRRLLTRVDYVEIANGSALTMMQRLSGSRVEPYVRENLKRIEWTLDLPERHRGEGLGWAVGSDAHLPGELALVGVGEDFDPHGDIFEQLSRRLRFSPVLAPGCDKSETVRKINMLRNGAGALHEWLLKQRRRYTMDGKSL